MSIKHKARRAVGTTGRLVLRLATDLKWENILDFRPAQHKTGTLTPINISIPYQYPRTQSKSVIYTTAERIRRRGQEGKELSSNKATSSVHTFPPLPRISQLTKVPGEGGATASGDPPTPLAMKPQQKSKTLSSILRTMAWTHFHRRLLQPRGIREPSNPSKAAKEVNGDDDLSHSQAHWKKQQHHSNPKHAGLIHCLLKPL